MKKIIAMYLPQYHEIPENNEWWGKGHTEWVSCKNAVSYGKQHYQPRIPYNGFYYNLLDEEFQYRQNKLASEYGIYGFCYYHYWFNGKLLLEKPMENMLKNKNIDNRFCISWANHSWVNKFEKKGRKLLIEQKYGDKADWIAHFEYMLPFFKDQRYISIDEKPVLVIYDVKDITCWNEMKQCWNELALENGLNGLYYINTLKSKEDVIMSNKYGFDAQFEYQPTFAIAKKDKLFSYETYMNIKRIVFRDFLCRPAKFSYDKVWNKIFKSTPHNGITTYLGGFTDWDVTARWKERGHYYIGGNPTKFGMYLRKQIKRAEQMKSDYIFVTAWNEWSEGAYLEPDEKYKFSYLEEVKRSIE